LPREYSIAWPLISTYVEEHTKTRVQTSGRVYVKVWQKGQGT